MPPITCVVVTPEQTLVNETCDFVALPLYDGEMGIAPKHSPMIGRLGYGELRLRTGGQTKRYYVNGGFVQVADDVVSVLTNRAVPAEQLDVAVAKEQLRSATQRRATTDEARTTREQLIAQARAQIRVAEKGGGKH